MGRLKTDMGRAGVPPGDGPLVGLYLLKNGALNFEHERPVNSGQRCGDRGRDLEMVFCGSSGQVMPRAMQDTSYRSAKSSHRMDSSIAPVGGRFILILAHLRGWGKLFVLSDFWRELLEMSKT